MNDSSGFFADPKVVISLLAIVISIISLIWTLSNQFEQNRRWDLLNAPNPEFKEAKWVNFKEVSREDAMNINWGYEPNLYGKGEATNIYVMPYYLAIYDVVTEQKLNAANSVFTVQEAENEIKRINFKGKVFLLKVLKGRFTIENMGKTMANQLSIKVSFKSKGAESLIPIHINPPYINLSGGQSTMIEFEFNNPIHIKLPEYINFQVNLEWKDSNDKTFSKLVTCKWMGNSNHWYYEKTVD
jgi:hypothetical protein